MKQIIFILFILIPISSGSWGFFAHKHINQLAVFTLPLEMIGFYKQHIDYITARSINADKRRYVLKNEAPKHYIDIDAYGDSALFTMPRYWQQAVEKYGEDTLMSYGIVPYHVNKMSYWLIKAFKEKNPEKIIKISTDLGHYIADANVPLHTTKNYNGQLTDQYGIHGFWESRLPELFFNSYDLLTGQATYVEDLQLEVWSGVVKAHLALDSVFSMEKKLTQKFSESKKYSFEDRGGATIKTYSFEFSEAYHKKLNGMVERRMKSSIKMIGDFWFSCWVKAGQPDLNELLVTNQMNQDSLFIPSHNMKTRIHKGI